MSRKSRRKNKLKKKQRTANPAPPAASALHTAITAATPLRPEPEPEPCGADLARASNCMDALRNCGNPAALPQLLDAVTKLIMTTNPAPLTPSAVLVNRKLIDDVRDAMVDLHCAPKPPRKATATRRPRLRICRRARNVPEGNDIFEKGDV